MSHTPGPWRWWTSNSIRRLTSHHLPGDRSERDGNVLHAFRSPSDGVADINVSTADMALIAAAPDLLACARSLCDHYADIGDGFLEEIAGQDPKTGFWSSRGPLSAALARTILTTRAAIAKAEGKP